MSRLNGGHIQRILQVFIDFHNGGLVTAAVAVIRG
jgi:hypothetical protein